MTAPQPTAVPESIVAMGALSAGTTVERITYTVKPLARLDADIYVTYNGVCATDLHMLANNWKASRYPMVPGHEVVGHVLRVGSDVTDLRVGDVVGLGCLAQKCDKCNWCRQGNDNLCPDKKWTYWGSTVDETGEHAHHGGFGSFIRTDSRGLFKIPSGYSEAHAGPLMCAGLTVAAPMHEFCHHSWNAHGKSIAILGIGGLGHLALQFASKMNFETVAAISRSEDKKAFASELGATLYINSADKAQMKAAENRFDMLLVCQSGGSFDVMQYIGLLRPYGTMHFVGVPDGNISFPTSALMFKRLSISSSPIGSSKQMRAMLDFAAEHNIKPIIEIFGHSQANEALAKVRDNSIRFRAVLKNDLA